MKYALMLLLLLTGLVEAAPGPNCDAPNTQLDMNVCAYQQAKTANSKLMRFSAHYLKRLGQGEQAQLFKKAETSWRHYRDAYCAFETSGVRGGSVHPMALADCHGAVTREHLQKLRALADCQEGDLSCPLPSPAAH